MTPRKPHEPPPRHEPPPPPPPGHEPPPPPPPRHEPLDIRIEELERRIARIEDCLGSGEAENRGLVTRGPEPPPPGHLGEMGKVIERLERLERQLGELEHRL